MLSESVVRAVKSWHKAESEGRVSGSHRVRCGQGVEARRPVYSDPPRVALWRDGRFIVTQQGLHCGTRPGHWEPQGLVWVSHKGWFGRPRGPVMGFGLVIGYPGGTLSLRTGKRVGPTR